MSKSDLKPRETFGHRLAAAVKSSRCSPGKVAIGAGVLPSAFNAYMKDQAVPAYDEAVRIANYLSIPAAWFLTGKHPPKIPDSHAKH